MQAQQLEPGPVVQQHLHARPLVGGGRELEHDAEVVGQLVVGEHQARPGVHLLDAEQGEAAFPGLPVGEVGQKQAAPSTGVESVDVVALRDPQRLSAQVLDGRLQPRTELDGQAGRHLGEQVHPSEQGLIGIVQQHRRGLPGAGEHGFGVLEVRDPRRHG